MDANRFDALSRTVGAQADRRGLLKAAAVGGLGLLGLAVGRDAALAKQCNNNNQCPKGNPRCVGGKCKQCKKNGDCNNNQECKNNKCQSVQCKKNKDCGKNRKCKNGKCKKK